MAWFDELNLPGAQIDGHFGYVTADGVDEGENPDVLLASGTVTFTATTPAARVDGAWLGIQPVTADIFEGRIVLTEDSGLPVRLLATDANIGVADWAWRASFDLRGFKLAPLTFKAPRGTTVNLTADLIPIKSQPYQIIEGASIVDTEVDTAGERMRFKMSDGTFTGWVNVPNGEPGAKGDKGDKGDPGKDGQSPTIAMGSVFAGANADAWMTGTPLARELNLTLPRGPKGDTPTWADLPGKPTSFPSTVSDVQGLTARLAALEGDTGPRILNSLLPGYISGDMVLQRTGKTVILTVSELKLAPNNGASTFSVGGLLPTGFRFFPPAYRYYSSFARTSSHNAGNIRVDRYGGVDIYDVANKATNVTAVWVTTQDFPASLPGAPA